MEMKNRYKIARQKKNTLKIILLRDLLLSDNRKQYIFKSYNGLLAQYVKRAIIIGKLDFHFFLILLDSSRKQYKLKICCQIKSNVMSDI